jgi:hypothetical protein
MAEESRSIPFPEEYLSERKCRQVESRLDLPVNRAALRDGQIVEREPSPLSDQQLMERIRAERDRRIQEYRWLIERHNDEVDLGIPTTRTAEQHRSDLQYVQALRDLPATCADLKNPSWPVPPA